MKRQRIIITQTFAWTETGGLCKHIATHKNRFIQKTEPKIRLKFEKSVFTPEIQLNSANPVKIRLVFLFFLFLPIRRIHKTYQTFAWI
jgi:hypothetical protein